MARGKTTSEAVKQSARENGKKGGRPKGSIGDAKKEAILARDLLIKEVKKELIPIIKGKIRAAKGAYYTVDEQFTYKDENGERVSETKEVIYKKLPDQKAADFLIDQVIGKAMNNMKHEVGDDVKELIEKVNTLIPE